MLVSAAVHLALFGIAAGLSEPASSQSEIIVAAAGRLEIRVAVDAAWPASMPHHAPSQGVDDPPEHPPGMAVPPDAQDSLRPPLAAAAVPEPGPEVQAGARQFDEVDGYLPRAALSRGPVPIGEIDLPWPPGYLPSGREAGTFWLFIDETGVVRRFVPDGPTLAPVLEDAARSSFLAARFAPGERDGRNVKSLIRIEVVFDNRRSAAPAATVVSQQIL